VVQGSERKKSLNGKEVTIDDVGRKYSHVLDAKGRSHTVENASLHRKKR